MLSVDYLTPFEMFHGRVYAALHSQSPWNETMSKILERYRPYLQLQSRVSPNVCYSFKLFAFEIAVCFAKLKELAPAANRKFRQLVQHCNPPLFQRVLSHHNFHFSTYPTNDCTDFSRNSQFH